MAKRRHLNVILTEDEYNRVKRALPTHGAISTITRTLLLRFVKGVELEQASTVKGAVYTDESKKG